MDSEAHFASRASDYGVPNEFMRNLSRNGITTLGHLAFAVFRPGAEFEEAAFDQWVTDMNGGVPLAMGPAAAMRRLHFEAEVVITSSVRSSVEATDAVPRPVPIAEKNARLEQLRNRFQGLNIHGTGKPSHCLLDECCAQFESRTLKYIEPARCTSRENEITAGKSDKKLRVDAGSLSIKETKSVPDEAISTTFHLSMCLRRRFLAYEFSNLIAFRAHELYVERLMKHLTSEPPVGFQSTTIAQVMRADREVFSFLSHRVPDIRPGANNVRPLDAALEEALRDYNTAFHLVPLPKHALKEENAFGPKRQPTEHTAGSSPYQKGKGKHKGGKSKSSGSNAAPKGYAGCVGRDAKNRPICFDFNLANCTKAPVGGACPKGRHVCFKGGCFKTHAFKDAHQTEMPSTAE